ncbi:MAG: VWA domain-containing protein [Candidatus Marinimicrobia bacterium]|nr:VWA domain-containing protein [Candidatus Neomarinimicrobiota bacterium]
MKRKIIVCVLIIYSILFAESTQIDLIFDASGSMWGQIDNVSKIEIARKAMMELMKDFEQQPNVQLALRIYGHTNKQCDNSILEIPMGKGKHSAIIEKINSIKPLGKTPIAYSLEHCAGDFSNESGEKIIVLITDGLESCDGDICTVAEQLKNAGIITMIHIVGFGLKNEDIKTLACIIAPFDGTIFGAGNAKELIHAFKNIVETTIKYNLELRAKDDDGNDVYAGFEIYDENGSVVAIGDNSLNKVCKIFLRNGTYKILTKNNLTDDEIELQNIEITENATTKKDVIFAERVVKIKIVNGRNEKVDGTVDILNQKGGRVNYADNSLGDYVTLKVVPDVYNIKVQNSNIDMVQIIEGVDLIRNKEFQKVVIFSLSTIEIKLIDGNGDNLDGDVYVLNENGEQVKHVDTSFNPVSITVPSGIYTIKVVDYKTHKEIMFENLDLKKNTEFKKEVVIE